MVLFSLFFVLASLVVILSRKRVLAALLRVFMLDARGGGVLSIFFIRRLGPSIYRSPQTISEISSTPKTFEILATKKYPHAVPKCIKMTLKYSPILCLPQKYPQNLHTPPPPQKNIHFSENPKKYLNSKF